jgi:hypothetical protein
LWISSLILTCVAPGCAPSLSSFQPAHVGPRGQFRASVGEEISLPTGTIDNAVDLGKGLARAAETRPLTQEEKLALFTAGLRITLTPPAFDQHLAVAYNFADAWEVSLRYAGGGLRLASRHQLLDQAEAGFDLAAGVGIARHTYQFPLADLVPILDLGHFERWSLDFPLVMGWHTRFVRAWIGPRLAFMHHTTDIVLHAPGTTGNVARDELARASGTGVFWGGQTGIAAGYRWIFLAIELTVVRFSGRASLDVFGRTANADTNATVFSPGIALMGEL